MPTDDSVIDPALRALPTTASADKQSSGTKRKARGNSTSKHALSSTPSRVTRRSAAAAAPSQIEQSEPSRGEEDNLIAYGSSKRTKLNSSTHTRSTSIAEPESLSKAASKPLSSSLPQRTLHPALRGFAYPFGLTPFRYACLTPHHPPPPPGDPLNPNLRRFDPAYTSHPQKPESKDRQIRQDETSSGSSSVGANDGSQYLSMADYMSSDTNDAAFQSLTALLAASQEYGHPGTNGGPKPSGQSVSRS